MFTAILLIVAGAAVLGVVASIVMSWASSRSALFNIVLGALLAVAVLAAALLIAYLMTRAVFPS